MNLFGLEIKFAKKDCNGKYVSQAECHRDMDGIHKRITELSEHIDIRFCDLKDWIKDKT